MSAVATVENFLRRKFYTNNFNILIVTFHEYHDNEIMAVGVVGSALPSRTE